MWKENKQIPLMCIPVSLAMVPSDTVFWSLVKISIFFFFLFFYLFIINLFIYILLMLILPQLTLMPDSYPREQGQGSNLYPDEH